MTTLWKWITVGLFIALAFSMLLNLWLARKARQWYAQSLFDKTWPAGTPSPSSTVVVPPGNLLLLLGDSRVAEWGEPNLPGFVILNAGISGATTAQIRLRAAALFEQNPAKAVVIEAGINDLKLAGVRPDLSKALVDECVENLCALASDAARGGALVLLCKIWPPGKVDTLRRLVWDSSISGAVTEVNRRLAGAKLGANVRVVEIFPEGILPEWQRDTLHLNAVGYRSGVYNLELELTKVSLTSLNQPTTPSR